jgi:glyoxylase-like metal-dependent hydrolase (beta-lactamase superfamily II)
VTTTNKTSPSANLSREEILAASKDMEPVAGVVDVDIPIATLWKCFTHANWWPRWNPCFFWAYNRNVILGQQLIWVFQPIRWWFLYKMPAIAKIVEVEEQSKVTWEVTALPGFYARHTYHMEDLGDGRTRFGSWEKATGWSFRLMKWFWIPHFEFVKNRSLEGAKKLEEIYRQKGAINDQTIARKNYLPFFISLLLAFILLITGIFAGWFYTSYVRQTAVDLAPGIHAVLGGGGNSLIVQDGKDVLLVDTKFPPGSKDLRRWISRHIDAPVTKIVNTHYHYDHTEGNILYPDAQILAHPNVAQFMQHRDSKWWSEHQAGIPTPVDLRNGTATLKIGTQEVILTDPGVAHTHGDLVVYLPKQNIVATGDLLFHTYYPFFDLGEGGVSIPGMVQAIRNLANQYPSAVFMPGHGPIANVSDLLRHADYLEILYQSVERAYQNNLSVDEAIKQIDLSQWHKHILPSFHDGKLEWATAANNIRWVNQLLQHPVD